MTIGRTTERGLCCGCGVCRVVCPQRAIAVSYDEASGQFLPSVDARRCSDCGVCLNCCPGANLPDVVPTGKKVPVKTAPLAVYAAYAKDRDLRWNSTSGGVVTMLVEKLLSEGVYKRAFVVRYDRFDGRPAELAPVETPSEVRRAAKSKYVPVSVGRVIEAVRDGELSGSIVVCTPCQLRAIRAALRHYGVTDDGVLFIGLFCQSVLDYRVYARYEKDYGGYDTLHFRDKEPNGWPGDTSLVANGEIRKVDRKVRMALKKDYTPKCCTVCTDKLNEDADISVGDCYIPGFKAPDGLGGVSSVVIRTEIGRTAFKSCEDDFICRATPYDMVRLAQKTMPSAELDSRVYHVALDVASLANRGQWLMFEAMLEQVRGRLPNAVVYVDRKAFVRDPEFFKSKGLLPLLDPGIADLLLYAPGFRYSDIFAKSEERMQGDEAYMRRFDKPGRRIVFMPQSFGPFKTEAVRQGVRSVVATADLIFAREESSLAYLEEAVGRDERFQLAPDFTCLFHEQDVGRDPAAESAVVVVPNVQMLKMTEESVAEAYRKFLREMIELLLARGESVVLLDHSPANDAEFVVELDRLTGGRCRVLENLSAGACKNVLRRAKLVITSRYHALVSALSEGAPALCTSWSRKYEDLVGNFGLKDVCLDVRQPESALAAVVKALENPSTCRADPERLLAWRTTVYDMWDKVFALVPDWAFRSSSEVANAIQLLTKVQATDPWSVAGQVAKVRELAEKRKRDRDAAVEKLAKVRALAEKRKQERDAAVEKLAKVRELSEKRKLERDALAEKLAAVRSVIERKA